MSTTIRSAAKSVVRALPEGVKERLRGTMAQRAFQLNTRGLRVDESVLAHVAANRRPVSIVIPSYNDVPLLRECLRSVTATCAAFDYEVIVVDDFCQAENSERLRALASEFERVRVIFKERRQGFAVSVNVGMAQALHDIVLLNSDIVAQEGWLDALQFAAYERDPEVGLVSPKLVYPDGRIQYAGTYYARLLAPQWFGHFHVGSPATRPSANVPGYNRSISGACVYIKRDAYERLGGLDEGYWLGFEDVDYGLQAWEKGIRCWYEPQSLLIHHESASRGYSQGKRELASMRRFWDRWRSLFLERDVEPVRADIVLSPASAPTWRRYVRDAAESLTQQGIAATVHEQQEVGRDEDLVARLSQGPSLVLSADWGAADTVWLATLDAGKPVYLLPTVESGLYPHDPALQARIVAGYRPEFDYIAANRRGADQLRAEAAWEVRHRVVPALRPATDHDGSGAHPIPLVATVGLDTAGRRSVERLVLERDARVEHIGDSDADDLLERVRALQPAVVIAFSEFPNSLIPLALMSTGAAYVGRENPRTTWEVLDGYNALLVEPGDHGALGRALDDLLADEDVRSELAANGRRSAERAAALVGPELAAALRSIARVSV